VNILCDFHHSDLWWSHHLIFEVGLGHRLYRPRGMEWFEQGYYNAGSPDIALQFLVHSIFTIEDVIKYPSCRLKPPANTNGLRATTDTLLGCLHYPLIHTLSFEEFKNTKINAIMVTLAENQEPWFRLRNDWKPKAKLIRENGNVMGWACLHPGYPNLLTSDLPTFKRAPVPNKLLYHQRFDTENVFTYKKPVSFDRVSCFMPEFRKKQNLVAFAEHHDFGRMEFVDYGHHSTRGFLTPKEKYADEMRASAFVWHVKPGGDGFGHVIHNAIALGRPVITIASDYRDTIAWPLLEDRKTCVFIDHDPVENSRKIASLSDPETILSMSSAAKNRFLDVVDYDSEQKAIGAFLETLR